MKKAAKEIIRIYTMNKLEIRNTKFETNPNFQNSKVRNRFFGRLGGRGFTLVEMLMAVVLITLLASAAGGGYVGTVRKMRAKKAVRDFMVGAKYARIMAIEKQSRCRMQIDEAGGKFWLIMDEKVGEAGETEQVLLRDLFFKPVEFGGGVVFEGIVIEPLGTEQMLAGEDVNDILEIVFSPDGTAQSAVVQIGDGRNHYAASIAAGTGRVKVYEGTAEAVEAVSIDLDDNEGAYEENQEGLYTY